MAMALLKKIHGVADEVFAEVLIGKQFMGLPMPHFIAQRLYCRHPHCQLALNVADAKSYLIAITHLALCESVWFFLGLPST